MMHGIHLRRTASSKWAICFEPLRLVRDSTFGLSSTFFTTLSMKRKYICMVAQQLPRTKCYGKRLFETTHYLLGAVELSKSQIDPLTMKDRLVPVHAIGFEDLKKRIAVQKAQTEAQLAGMKVKLNIMFGASY